jgi:hypothetical protein
LPPDIGERANWRSDDLTALASAIGRSTIDRAIGDRQFNKTK